MSQAFSENLHNILTALNHPGRPRGQEWYPRQCAGADLRVRPAETADLWFRRSVHELLAGDVQQCAIEENLAAFLKFGWEQRQFTFIQCQAFAVVNGTLAGFLAGQDANTRYLRLEYDPEQLGELFSHPIPHIHSQPNEAPRFDLPLSEPRCAVADFFDFLYRNFCHRLWVKWARSVWRREAPDEIPFFDTVAECFQKSSRDNLETLRALAPRVARLKSVLRAAKARMPLTLSIDMEHRDLLNYCG